MSKFKVGDLVMYKSSITKYGIVGDRHDYDGVWCHWKDTIQDALKENAKNTYNMTWVNSGKVSLVTEYNQGETKVGRRTFMLKAESPSLFKGAIVQERCDDGTQPYDLINADTHSKDPSFTVSFAKRELVEDAPKFWVEVFKVTPEYMTQAELDQWKAFKNGTKKRRGRPAGSKNRKETK